MSIEETQVFADRYILGRELASSPMATVHLAQDRELGRQVALKILGPDVANDVEAAASFRAHATAASVIRDPHVVATYDVDVAEGRPYIAMEFVEGRSLADALPDGRSVSVQRSVMIATGIATGLAAGHRAGIVHGGLTPHNVLLNTTGDVKLTDFGVASASAGSNPLERAEFAAPEQLRGTAPNVATDVYGLGAILFSLVTGFPPFTGSDTVSITEQKLAGPAVPASSRVADLPPALDSVIARLLEPSPSARYANAEEALIDLRRVAAFSEPATAIVSSVATDTAAMAATSALPVLDNSDSFTSTGKPSSDQPAKRMTAIWIAVAILVIAVGGLAWWLLASRDEAAKNTIAVPAVVGMQQTAAEAEISAAGLSPSVSQLANPDFAAGLVFSQSPTDTTKVPSGTVVILKVSTGPEPTTTTTGKPTTSTSTSTTTSTSTSTSTTTTLPTTTTTV